MIIRPVVLFLFVVAASAGGREARAQSASLLFARGVVAYRALEYDSAATLFRRALASGDSLTGRDRANTLHYLGAAELLRGKASAASEAFAQSLAVEPLHRIDDLIFPPVVTRAFEEVRLASAFTAVQVASDTSIIAGSQSLRIRVFASAQHEAVVSLLRANGTVARQLHKGVLSDSLDVLWNGMDAEGERPLSGALVLLVSAVAPVAHGGERRIRLNVTAEPVDTTAHPVEPSSPRVPAAGESSVPALKALLAGTVAGTAAIFLPQLVGREGTAMPERYAVGAALGTAGVAGFLIGRRDERRQRTLANSARELEGWRQAVERVRAENDRRLRSPRLRIIAGQEGSPSEGGS